MKKDNRMREPLTDTQLLMTITIGIFIVMYLVAMIALQGGFLHAKGLCAGKLHQCGLYDAVDRLHTPDAGGNHPQRGRVSQTPNKDRGRFPVHKGVKYEYGKQQ